MKTTREICGAPIPADKADAVNQKLVEFMEAKQLGPAQAFQISMQFQLLILRTQLLVSAGPVECCDQILALWEDFRKHLETKFN